MIQEFFFFFCRSGLPHDERLESLSHHRTCLVFICFLTGYLSFRTTFYKNCFISHSIAEFLYLNIIFMVWYITIDSTSFLYINTIILPHIPYVRDMKLTFFFSFSHLINISICISCFNWKHNLLIIALQSKLNNKKKSHFDIIRLFQSFSLLLLFYSILFLPLLIGSRWQEWRIY